MMLKEIWSSGFWFSINRNTIEASDKLFLGLALFSFAAAMVLGLWSRRATSPVMARLLGKFFDLGLAFGLLGVVWFGFRYQLVAALGTRFAFLVLVIAAVVWKLKLLKYFFTGFRREQADWHRERQRQKYLQP